MGCCSSTCCACCTKDGSFVNKIMFPAPSPATYDEATIGAIGGQLVWIPRADDMAANEAAQPLRATHIPCVVAHNRHSKRLIIYCHGNATDVGQLVTMMGKLSAELGASVIAVEYPGYGVNESQRQCNESGVLREVHRVYTYMTTIAGYAPRDVCMFGRSIGSGAAVDVAATREVGGLILLSAYTSVKGLIEYYACACARVLAAERFASITKVPAVTCPVVLMHGTIDRVIPCTMSQQLHTAFVTAMPERECVLRLVEDMHHNNVDDFWATHLFPAISRVFGGEGAANGMFLGIPSTQRHHVSLITERPEHASAGPVWEWARDSPTTDDGEGSPSFADAGSGSGTVPARAGAAVGQGAGAGAGAGASAGAGAGASAGGGTHADGATAAIFEPASGYGSFEDATGSKRAVDADSSDAAQVKVAVDD